MPQVIKQISWILALRNFSIFATVYILLLSSGAVAAPDTGNSLGVTVSPAVATISVNSGDIEKTATIGVKNNNSYAVSLTAELREVDESSGILVPSGELGKNLKEVVTIDNPNLILEPSGSANVKITVKNDSALSPGGTYLALTIKQTDDSNNRVGVQSAIGAGIFITKQQGAVRKLTVDAFDIKQVLLQEPKSSTVLFKNIGNVHLVPRGVITTTNIDQSVYYQKGIVNQESLMILPGKTLNTEVVLRTIKPPILPSHQKVILQYRFDGTDEIKTVEKYIWVIPYIWYIFGVCLIAFVIIGIKLIRKIKVKQRKQKRRLIEAVKHPIIEQKIINQPQKKILVQDHNDGEKIRVRKE